MRFARVFCALMLAGACAACGGGESTFETSQAGAPGSPTAAGDAPGATTRSARGSVTPNRPPHVAGVALEPAAPRQGDQITAALRVMDPDGDRLHFDVEWFRNDQRVARGPDLTWTPAQISRGDSIRATVQVSDGQETTTVETTPVRVVNSPPELVSVKLMPEKPTSSTPLIVLAEARDGDGDPVELEYAWLIGDSPIPDAREASLPAGKVKRGDKVRVQVTPRDEFEAGNRFVSVPVAIHNGAPKIASEPSQVMAGPDRYEYQIVAEDPDGDGPLRYELVSGPPGMQVDLVSGLVSWTVPQGIGGRFDIKLSVSDVYGEKAEQSYAIDLAWDVN